jgi:hypothetical protein
MLLPDKKQNGNVTIQMPKRILAMKIAAIYSVWDGVELLQSSIDSIRKHVHAIIVVWQRQSNWGEDLEGLEEEVSKITGIDELIQFAPYVSPERLNGVINETNKRALGYAAAKALGATHYMHIDCDEMHEPSTFDKAIDYLSSGYESTYCLIDEYLTPTHKIGTSGLFVPFITNICVKSGVRSLYPVLVDPTRKPETRNAICVGTMHHYTFVRKDIERKLKNSSAKVNYNVAEECNSIRASITNPLYFKGQPTILVPDYYNLTRVIQDT